ncbi:MAG TPA: alpha-L-rhamnosidase C-terminal domain-containing protein [Polyangiaceae bacterium]|nr:alpha-L-rhamnosidase C-terminal domain-containing protein [Polyangiaceae bacterium]
MAVGLLSLACGSLPAGTRQAASSTSGALDPTFVWADASGEGRAQVVWFRRDLELDAAPDEASLQLFADSRYLLFVNGSVVASGPARFYPERPEYDSVDLKRWLRVGHNTLAVQVLSFGTASFQLRRHPGAFAAWGSVRTGERRLDLGTPGDWRCARDGGYDSSAPRLSFAMPPIEVYDARRADVDFLGGAPRDGNGAGWTAPTPLAIRDAWGALAPRSIPALTADWIAPKRLLTAFALDDSETLLSFRVPVPDASRAEYQAHHLLLARTKIYSPRAGRVPFGLWWGEHYINGEGPLPNEGLSPGQRNRNVVWVPLRAGWNDFFVRYTSVFGSWDFYASVPREAGLEFSATGVIGDAALFEVAGPFAPEQERALSALSLPPAATPELPIEWRPIARGERNVNPAVEVSWRRRGSDLPLDPARTHDIPIAAGRDTALVFDFGGTELGRLSVEYEGPAGSTLDFAWAEELVDGVPAVLRQHGLFTGARHVSAGGASRFQTIKPYGMRYLQLNVSRQTAPLTLRRIGLVREVYPFEPRGRFESSDPALDALWRMGERTLRVCAEDSYIDTPFRERGLYAGDLLVQIAVTLATSGDLRLAQRSLRLLQGMYRDLFVPGAERHPDEIELLEDYPLLSLEAYRWVVDASGDLGFARELFPAYRHLVDTLLARRGPDGTLTSSTVFIEWVLPDDERHDVENTAYHALLARALSSLAHVARRLDDDAVAAGYARASEEVARLLEPRFWDAAAGAFSDGVRAGERSGSHRPISSAWPSLWGFTSERQEDALQRFWRELGADAPLSKATSPYGGFFVLGALYRHGNAGIAEDYMRRYWAPMLADAEGTLWEHFDRSYGTSSHAWSAAPTYYLSSQVLGVQLGYPDESDGGAVLIAPQAESLSWARGTVPHARGSIDVDWRVDGDVLRMSVQAPPGVAYRVSPRGRLGRMRLELNGELRRK